MLEDAVRKNKEGAKSYYYLGNLSLVYYNKKNDVGKAFALAASDSRVFLELDQLYKTMGMAFEERLRCFEENIDMVRERDDAIRLCLQSWQKEESYAAIKSEAPEATYKKAEELAQTNRQVSCITMISRRI